MFVYLFVCLFVYLFVCLFTCLFICLFTWLFVCLLVCLIVYLFYRQSGATPDSLKNEEDNFHKLEVDIARGLRRVFRKGRGMSFQQWSQLLYPRSPVVASHLRDSRKRFGTLPRRRMVRLALCTFDTCTIFTCIQ